MPLITSRVSCCCSTLATLTIYSAFVTLQENGLVHLDYVKTSEMNYPTTESDTSLTIPILAGEYETGDYTA